MRTVHLLSLATASLLVVTGMAFAQQKLAFDINRISDAGVGEKIGTGEVSETKTGLSFKTTVTGLPKGARGFHVHENGNCGPGMKDGKMMAGVAAGEHYDPDARKSHKGPKGAGHKGDLPALTVAANGSLKQTVVAPRLKLTDVKGRSVVIHEGPDNYNDTPENGGGKGRIACGVIPK